MKENDAGRGWGRWDVVFSDRGPCVEPHFCRQWTDGDGCYGSDPKHGCSWEEARALVLDWWGEATPEFLGYEQEEADVIGADGGAPS